MKILLLRFSSIGDVLQTMSVAAALSRRFPEAEVHWATRADFKDLVECQTQVKKVFVVNKSEGLKGLRQLASELKKENYSYVYDAHNNLRSRLLCWFLLGPFELWGRLRGVKFIRRSIPRLKRFLLFKLRWNLFEQPFSGQRDLLDPLKKWGIPREAPSAPVMQIPAQALESLRTKLPSSFVALAPSAAYELKRWPFLYWKELIKKMPSQAFVVLGGPTDRFLQELQDEFPDRVLNMAGQLNLVESAAVVQLSQGLVANDTGVLHMGEQLGRPCVALMGPAPFGFPSRPNTQIMEIQLSCRPCSKHGQGPCVNAQYHKCLADIHPSVVVLEVEKFA